MLDLIKNKMIFLEKINGSGLKISLMIKIKASLHLFVVEHKFYQQKDLFKRLGIYNRKKDYFN
jgi:hypothetical protein